MSNDENILVFPSSILKIIGEFQGLNFNFEPYLAKILSPQIVRFLPRDMVENDPSFKQIIPYVILKHRDKLLFYVRGKGSGESRLISKGSIGIGGHVSRVDDSIFSDNNNFVSDIYKAAVLREVNEELNIDCKFYDSKIAVLNDDSNDVGRVHFGVIHLWELQSQQISKREKKITQLTFLTPNEILNSKYTLENWSSICLGNINQIMQGRV